MATKPSQFRLDPDTLTQLNQIAVDLSQRSGKPVNRSDALRHIIHAAASRVATKANGKAKKTDKSI